MEEHRVPRAELDETFRTFPAASVPPCSAVSPSRAREIIGVLSGPKVSHAAYVQGL